MYMKRHISQNFVNSVKILNYKNPLHYNNQRKLKLFYRNIVKFRFVFKKILIFYSIFYLYMTL